MSMADIRKIIIIFVVAILFSVLVFSVIEAVYPRPEYNNFCKMNNYAPQKPWPVVVNCTDMPISTAAQKDCSDKKGYMEYVDYDSNNCPTKYECNTCQTELDVETKRHDVYVFYISAFLALVAIFIGLYLPAKENDLNEWIGTGFMLGGTFALFFGTVQSFNSLDRLVRPIIILLELILVIFVAYRKVGNLRQVKLEKKKSKK